jgi:hypothetical protein
MQYVDSGLLLPIPQGTLVKVRNPNTNWPNRCNLWFPGPGVPIEFAYDSSKGYMLNSGDETTPDKVNLPVSLSVAFEIIAAPLFVDPNPYMSVSLELIYTD